MTELLQLIMFGNLVFLTFGTAFTLAAFGWRKALAWFSFWIVTYIILIALPLQL